MDDCLSLDRIALFCRVPNALTPAPSDGRRQQPKASGYDSGSLHPTSQSREKGITESATPWEMPELEAPPVSRPRVRGRSSGLPNETARLA